MWLANEHTSNTGLAIMGGAVMSLLALEIDRLYWRIKWRLYAYGGKK